MNTIIKNMKIKTNGCFKTVLKLMLFTIILFNFCKCGTNGVKLMENEEITCHGIESRKNCDTKEKKSNKISGRISTMTPR